MSYQDAKRLVRDMIAARSTAPAGKSAAAMAPFLAPDHHWRATRPFAEQADAAGIAAEFWDPLKQAMGRLQHRPDIFFAGHDTLNDPTHVWVVEMAHYVGTFTAPWLGLRPSGRMTFLRVVEFHRVAGGRIAETYILADVLGVIHQAGLYPLRPMTGAAIVSPGPRTHDGLLYAPQPEEEAGATMRLVQDMVADLTGGGVSSPDDHLARFWHDDMCWFGPAGIGASTGFAGYNAGHTHPFESQLSDVRFNGHVMELAEGRYAGFVGWPSLTMKNTGDYAGIPANDAETRMTLVDLYRREGDKLAENWIFIDMIKFAELCGTDPMEMAREKGREMGQE